MDVDRLRELLVTVRKTIERRETLLRLDADVARQFEFYGLIGRSPGMQELFDSVRRFAPYGRTVLVPGETGTGKELVAKALHRLGPRRDKKLITVNCSAVVETQAISLTGNVIMGTLITVSPTTLTFPATALYATSAAQTVTVTNPSTTATVTVTGVAAATAEVTDAPMTPSTRLFCSAPAAKGELKSLR